MRLFSGFLMHVLCALAGLSTIEAYNAKTDEWFHVLPMSTRRSSVGVGVVNGEYCSQFSFKFLRGGACGDRIWLDTVMHYCTERVVMTIKHGKI